MAAGACCDEVTEMSLYALSKVAGEAATRRWRDNFGLDAVSVRFSDVYGHLDRDTGARNRHNAPYWICRKALRLEAQSSQERFRVAAGSLEEPCWDLIDAGSVARGLCTILRSASRPERSLYHLALGRTPTHREVLASALALRLQGWTRWERNGKVFYFNEVTNRIQEEPPLPDPPIKQGELEPGCPVSPSLAQFVQLASGSSTSEARMLDSFVELVDAAAVAANGDVCGDVDIRSLPPTHWLLQRPMDIEPTRAEFGWEPTPLREALAEYMEHLRGGLC